MKTETMNFPKISVAIEMIKPAIQPFSTREDQCGCLPCIAMQQRDRERLCVKVDCFHKAKIRVQLLFQQTARFSLALNLLSEQSLS